MMLIKSNSENWLSRMLVITALSILLCGVGFFSYHLHTFSKQQEQLREDYCTIKSVSFGVFSIDNWRERIGSVLDQEISDFSFKPEEKEVLYKKVDHELHSLVRKTVKEINKRQKTVAGKVKKIAVKAIIDTSNIQKLVPEFSHTIVDNLTSPASTNRLKNIATSKLHQLEEQTYDSTKSICETMTHCIYHKYNVTNEKQFEKVINARLTAIQKVTNQYLLALIGCVLAAFCLWGLMRKQTHLKAIFFFMFLFFAGILLAVGITSPIIEVEAEVNSFDLMLMGETISFGNQVLFFQSKSILGIVEALIRQSQLDTVLVGSLILLFVILLPVLRIAAKGFQLLGTKKIAQNKTVHFIAYDAAKWDMSDVMVIGILMTYIGLNGILNSQLSNLVIHSSVMNTEILNNTSLQPGYFVFVCYVVVAAILDSNKKTFTS